MTHDKLSQATIAAHAAGAQEPATGGVVPAISVATTYLRDEEYRLFRADNIYGRDQNDTVRQAEAVLRALEGAEATLLFPSGMAAVAALFRQVPGGGRVIVQSGIYWGVTAWAREFCARRGITLTEVDAADGATLEAACGQAADLVWIEVPSNPWLKSVDIARAAQAAHGAGAMLGVDATAASPVILRPLALGADVVMHSATKVMNGHSDVLAGVLSTNAPESALWRDVAKDRHDAGAIIGPFEAWLLMRGLRTLPLRIERMCRSALSLAQYLDTHPGIETVFYPGLPGHDGHGVAAGQMRGGFGYLMSALVRGGHAEAARVVSNLRLFGRATSLGGVESLIEHRHVIEPHTGIPENLLRISIGIEDEADLRADLEQALAR
jgi:cystathionine gamma-synthase